MQKENLTQKQGNRVIKEVHGEGNFTVRETLLLIE